MPYARRLDAVAHSATIEISDRVKRLRAEGRDVINMAAARPNFDAPPEVKAATVRALADPEFSGYTESRGLLELREAASRRLESDLGLRYDPHSEILITVGASEAVVITAALTAQTRGSVHAERLARLPDGGIVINVARGAIIDQDALFAELERGRLRAGLDVLDSGGKDFAEPGHPCRQWPNLLLTGHTISRNPWNGKLYNANRLTRLQRVGIDNLRRFVLGKPLQFTFDTARYDRST